MRKTARVEDEYPYAKKSHRNDNTRRFAGSAAARRREYRRAAAGAHSCALTACVTRRARREVSSRARAGGFGVPRAAFGEYGVLTFESGAQNAESAGKAEER